MVVVDSLRLSYTLSMRNDACFIVNMTGNEVTGL